MHETECCAEANKFRCMTKGKKYMKMSKTVYWIYILFKNFRKMTMTSSGRSWRDQKNGQTGRRFHMMQKVFGKCEAKNGIKVSELLEIGTDGHQRIWQNDENNLKFRGRKSLSWRDKELENWGKKEKNYKKRVSETVNNFEMEGLIAPKCLWILTKEKIMQEETELSMKKMMLWENTRLCMRKTSGAIVWRKIREVKKKG